MIALIIAYHIAGFMAYLVFIPEASAKGKVMMALFWPIYAAWDFFFPIYEDLKEKFK